MPATAEAGHSLPSSLSSRNREIWPHLADFAVSAGGNSLHFRLAGGEGGIRTLGTGVSPYNGLANSTRPTPIARNQSVTVTSDVLSRAESGCLANVYAPECAPLETESPSETPTPRLVPCSVGDLKPHPSYARHNLSVQPFKLAALEEQGEFGFSIPILITADRCIIDGYARWELAKRKGRLALACLEYDIPEHCALEWLIQPHRSSQGLIDFIRIELALDLEAYFNEKARLNQSAGGPPQGFVKVDRS